MTNNNNYLDNSLLGALNKITLRQGICSPNTIGELVGSVRMEVDDSNIETIFGETPVVLSDVLDGATEWIIPDLVSYSVVLYRNNIKLNLGIDYTIVDGTTITREYITGENYIALLYAKV